MKRLILLMPLIISACGFHPYDDKEAVRWVNATDEQVAYFEDVIDYTNSVAPNPVDLNGYVIELYKDQDELIKTCNNPKAAGCTYVDWKFIAVLMWEGDENLPMSAWVLGHEMGHVYYDQYTGDADGKHKHDEWFNIHTEGSIVSQVYWHFYSLQHP